MTTDTTAEDARLFMSIIAFLMTAAAFIAYGVLRWTLQKLPPDARQQALQHPIETALAGYGNVVLDLVVGASGIVVLLALMVVMFYYRKLNSDLSNS